MQTLRRALRLPVSAAVSAAIRAPRLPATASDFRRINSSRLTFNRLSVRVPGRVQFCVQRKQRREVLFAREIAGFRRSPGAGGHYRRNEDSNWRC